MKEYTSPDIVILYQKADVITASTGDTPIVDADW